MTRILVSALLVLALSAPSAFAQARPAVGPKTQTASAPLAAGFWEQVRAVIQSHLGRPYVWGAAGLKSFDCSGFVWRVMQENGVYFKRTTARKLYMSLPKVSDADRYAAGNIVFFDALKHCGIVESKSGFYHAGVIGGTNLSRFDALWRKKVCGFRAMPKTASSASR